VWLFARSSERLLHVSLGHSAALTRLLHEPQPDGPPDAFIERALAAVSEQFDGARVTLLAAGAKDSAPEAALVVPLEAAGRRLGTLAIQPATTRRFDADEVELAQALARQIAITLRFAELAASDRRSALHEDRTRIARDVHDSLAQGFTGIVVQLHAAEEVLVRDAPRARAHIERARELARTSLREARRSIWAMRPPSLDRESLPAAFERIARELVTGTDVELRVELIGRVAPLTAIAEGELLRIGQELIVNAIRHGRAHRVRVATEYESQWLTLRIDDDGRGPPPGAGPSSGPGFGSTGLRERVGALGGSLTVETSSGRGTCTTIVVPLPGRAPGVGPVREVG
jgi:signal transduction histidine kinase